jgi:hypothetical protein
MKSVGEVMAIGRTFQEALQKALRSLETGGRDRARRPRPRSLDRAARRERRQERDPRALRGTPTPTAAARRREACGSAGRVEEVFEA